MIVTKGQDNLGVFANLYNRLEVGKAIKKWNKKKSLEISSLPLSESFKRN